MTVLEMAAPWMVGHCCDTCDEEIEPGQVVIVKDIDWSDTAGRAIAKIVHAECEDMEVTA